MGVRVGVEICAVWECQCTCVGHFVQSVINFPQDSDKVFIYFLFAARVHVRNSCV